MLIVLAVCDGYIQGDNTRIMGIHNRFHMGIIDSHSRWLYLWLPFGYVKIAMKNGPFIDVLPIQNGDFP